MTTIFFAFRDTTERRAGLRAPDALDRYRLFGLDDVQARGARVRHNLEHEGPLPAWARAAARAVNGLLRLSGGYGGDFDSVLRSLRTANRADIVFSTTDAVGIPLILLKRVGLLRPPVVYAAIGLPERLIQLRGRFSRRLYLSAFRRAHTIITYAASEAEWLRAWMGPGGPPVVFIPFGVDVDAFSPNGASPDVDVVSVGADPRREFALLTTVASRHPDLSFRIVASADHARSLGTLPANVALETDVPLERVRDRLARARVVALPVRRNNYSGATTVLLQAMAMGKPVVVSRTDAIAKGYSLEDGINCRLVEPGDVTAFEHILLDTLADPRLLGARARETVECELTWKRYTDALWATLSHAWEREPS